MKNVPMVDFPKAAPPKLSTALEAHRAYVGTYARYRPVKRIACDECVNVLHEAWRHRPAPPRRNAFTPHASRCAAPLHAPRRTMARPGWRREGAQVSRWHDLTAGGDSRVSDGFRVETGVPGAVVAVVERSDGVVEELNGAGSLVGLLFPYGVDGVQLDEGEWY